MNVLDSQLAALGDPTRRAILGKLAGGEATVGEIAAPFDISQPAISQHLKVLEKAGLIERRIDGQRRPCRLATDAFDPLQSWIQKILEAKETNYSRLDALLTQGQDKQGKDSG